VLIVASLAFGIRSCYVAEGVYHNAHAPKLEFIGTNGQQDGLPAFKDTATFELVFQPMDSRRAFVEIVTDNQYSIKSSESYVGGWGQNQGSWGGTVVDSHTVSGKSRVQLGPSQLAPGKYWIRAALFAGTPYRERDSSFDRIMYSLVGAPLDYKDGYIFIYENGSRNYYWASEYFPFYITGSDGGNSPTLSNIAGSQSRLTVGVFAFDVPSQWQVLSGADEQTAKRQIEASTQQTAKQYGASTGQQQDSLGIQSFKALRLPSSSGWFIVYTSRMPPQSDYLTTMERDQGPKIAWGRQQGTITNVVSNGRAKVGGSDVIKTEFETKDGSRLLSIYYWSAKDPGVIGTISVVVSPGRYESVKASVDAALNSLHIE